MNRTEKNPQKTLIYPPATLLLLPLLAGCGSGAVHLEPAPDAANPQCASAMVAMPTSIGGLQQRETTAQAATAWGDPADIIIKCGVEVPQPVIDPCVSVNGVDWVLKPAEEQTSAQGAASTHAPTSAPSSTGVPSDNAHHQPSATQNATGTWTATTFGREPALQITFNADAVSSSTLLLNVESAVKQLPQTKKCTNLADTLNTDQ